MNFQKIIKDLRLQNGYTQKYVADKLQIKQTSYSKYELGKARPEYENLVKIAELYNVSVDYLFGLADS